MKTQKVIAGIDMNRENPQLCFYDRTTQETRTAPLISDAEPYTLKELLEELDLRAEEETLSSEAMSVLQRRGAELLGRSFSSIGLPEPKEQIEGLTITTEKLTRPLVSLLRGICEQLGLDRRTAFLQDYRESFFFHTLYQDPELWHRNVGFFRFEGRKVTFYSMAMDNMSRPISVYIDEGITIRLSEDRRRWDEQFYNMANASLRQNMYTSIFINGEVFDRSWAARSVSLLCKGGRKAFVVDNLFARGACYAAREKAEKRRLGDYLYMGDGLIRSHIGMEMLVQGRETYYPLISAGVNWYETEKTCECILAGKPELIFTIRKEGEESERHMLMPLPGMPERPPKTTRIRLHLFFSEPGKCVIEAEDLGFGELYPASGKIWRDSWEG